MSDKLLSGHYALDSSFCLVVREICDEHAIERALARADHILTTEATPAVFERKQEAALDA